MPDALEVEHHVLEILQHVQRPKRRHALRAVSPQGVRKFVLQRGNQDVVITTRIFYKPANSSTLPPGSHASLSVLSCETAK